MFTWLRNRKLRRHRWKAAARHEIKFLPHLHMKSSAVRIPDRADQYPAYVPVSSYPHPSMEWRADQLDDVLVCDLGMAIRHEFVPGWGVVYLMPPRARAAVAERGGDFSPGWRAPSDGGDLALTELCLMGAGRR